MRCLFEDFDSQPPELKKIMDRWQDRLVNGLTYENARTLSEELRAIGYEFDMGLDTEPYGLRPIGISIHELDGFENI